MTGPRGGQPSASRRRRRFLVLWASLSLLGLALLSVAVSGLLTYRNAQAVQADLMRVQSAASAGEQEQARAAVVDARGHVRGAQGALANPLLRMAGAVPYLGRTVDDVRRLVAAADDLTAASDVAVSAYARLAPGKGQPSPLFQGGRVDLTALSALGGDVDAIAERVQAADDELAEVNAGFWSPLVGGPTASGQEQIAKAQDLLVTAQESLEVAPSLLGADGPRRYLVVVLNPAELRTSGGAPLSLVTVAVADGALEIEKSGATERLTEGNSRVSYEPVPGNGYWHPAGVPTRFVNANFSPDWPTSGEELARAYQAQLGGAVDGVIALDPVVLANILTRTGPIEAPGYGQVTGENLVEKLLVESYATLPLVARREANAVLVGGIVSRLTSGSQLLPSLRGMAEGIPGRHLLAYFRDPAVQTLIADRAVGGAFVEAEDGADLLSVFTANGNASKVDVMQRRSVVQAVTLAEDGSATVQRVVTITNGSEPYRPVLDGPPTDPNEGYFTAMAGVAAFNYLPPTAEEISVTSSGGEVRAGTDRDTPVFQVTTLVPSQGSFTITSTYRLPAPPAGSPAYRAVMQTQQLVTPETLELTVTGPGAARLELTGGEGMSLTRLENGYRLSGPVTRDLDLALRGGTGGAR